MDKRKDQIKDIIKKLDLIQKYFEKEEVDLDQALKKYEEGVKLTKKLKKLLTDYKSKLETIKKEQDALI